MSDNTMKDIIKNKNIRRKLEVAPIDDKMRENRLRWFGRTHTPMDECWQLINMSTKIV